VYFLSGSYFPTSSLPFVAQVLASLVPLTFGLDGIRRVMVQGEGLSNTWLNIVALLIFIVILLPLAKYALDYMENLGKKEGRLTLRWQ
jgi:ABC-2 type transport system permease protein